MASPQQPEPLSPAGYLKHLHNMFTGVTDVTLRLDEDEPYDPAADAPWSVIERIELRDA